MNDTIEKLYFSIGEVANQLSIKPSCVRYWETVFGKLHTATSKSGNRKFTLHDVERVRYITQLLRTEGYTLSGARKQFLQRYPRTKNFKAKTVITYKPFSL